MRRELEPREAGAAAEDLPGRPPDSPGGLCGGQRRESVCPVLRWRGCSLPPQGVYKGDLEEDMLLEVDLEGRVLSGTGRPSSESPMHLALYRTRPEVGGVVHTHAPYSVFRPTWGGPDRAHHCGLGPAAGAGPRPALAAPGDRGAGGGGGPGGGGHSAALLAHHGAVTWGRDVVRHGTGPRPWSSTASSGIWACCWDGLSRSWSRRRSGN